MHGATPVQSFVDVAHPVTEEELTRPRYGRPVRKSLNGSAESPKPETDRNETTG
jgi:hypothetical protein